MADKWNVEAMVALAEHHARDSWRGTHSSTNSRRPRVTADVKPREGLDRCSTIPKADVG